MVAGIPAKLPNRTNNIKNAKNKQITETETIFCVFLPLHKLQGVVQTQSIFSVRKSIYPDTFNSLYRYFLNFIISTN